MADSWKQNEEKSEEEELVVTDHRDAPEDPLPLGFEGESAAAEEVPDEQLREGDPRSALEVLGEDVASSPARRGHEDPETAAGDDRSA